MPPALEAGTLHPARSRFTAFNLTRQCVAIPSLVTAVSSCPCSTIWRPVRASISHPARATSAPGATLAQLTMGNGDQCRKRAGIAKLADCRQNLPMRAVPCPPVPTRLFHGKEGVVGSSPTEGLDGSPVSTGLPGQGWSFSRPLAAPVETFGNLRGIYAALEVSGWVRPLLVVAPGWVVAPPAEAPASLGSSHRRNLST